MSSISFDATLKTEQLDAAIERSGTKVSAWAKNVEQSGARADAALSGQAFKQSLQEQIALIKTIEKDIKDLEKAYASAGDAKSKKEIGGDLTAARQALEEEKAVLKQLSNQAEETSVSVSKIGTAGTTVATGIKDGTEKAGAALNDLSKSGQTAGNEVTATLTKQQAVIATLEAEVKKLQAAYDNAATTKEKMEIGVKLGDSINKLNEEKTKLNELQVQAKDTAKATEELGKTTQAAGEIASKEWTKSSLKQAINEQKTLVDELKTEVKQLKKEYEAMAPGAAKFGPGGAKETLMYAERALKEEQARLKDLQKISITDTKEEKSAIDKLIGSVGKWAAGLFSLGVAMKAGKAIINSTSATSLQFHKVIAEATTMVNYFFKSIATGDWSNFFEGMKEATRAAREYVVAMEDIERRRNEMLIKESQANLQIGILRESTYDKSDENTLNRIRSLQEIIKLEKEIYTKKSAISRDELEVLAKKIAATNKLTEDEVKNFVSNYSHLKEQLELGNKYLELQAKLSVASRTTTIGPGSAVLPNASRIQEIKDEISLLGDGAAAAANFAKKMNSLSVEEQRAIAEIWAKMDNEANEFNTKTRRYQTQLAGARKSIVDAFKSDIDDAKQQAEKLIQDIQKMREDMLDFGNEKPDTEYRKTLAQAKREYENDIKGNEWSQEVMKAANDKYQLAKLNATKKYYQRIHELAVESNRNLPKPINVLGGYAQLRTAEETLRQLRKQASEATDETLRNQILKDIDKERKYIEEIKKLIANGTFDIDVNVNPVNLTDPTRLISPSKAVVKQAKDAADREQKEIDKRNANQKKYLQDEVELRQEILNSVSNLVVELGALHGMDQETMATLNAELDLISQMMNGDFIGAATTALTMLMSIIPSRTEKFERQIEHINALLDEQARLISKAQRTGGEAEELKQYISILEQQKRIYEKQIGPDALKMFQKLGPASAETVANIYLGVSKEMMHGYADLLNTIEDAQQEYEDFLNGQITQNTLTDAIAQGFEESKGTVRDFASYMNDVLTDAVMNIFKTQFLLPKVNEMLMPVVEAALDDNELTQTEIDLINSEAKRVADLVEGPWKKLTQSLDFGDKTISEQKGLSGAIQRQITEDTGTELAGLMRKISDDNRMNRDYNRLAVDNLVAIEANTLQTVAELKLAVAELKTISTNTKPAYSGLG